MQDQSDSSSVEFWDTRFETGRLPWDLGGVPLALQRLLASEPPGGRVLIPGCGSGYEVRAFVDAGWQPVAVDFSAAAVARAQRILGPLGRHVVLGDFFTCRLGPEPFDAVYERTFLCSLPKHLWLAYSQRMAELLRPGGRLVGVFFHGHDDEPPPYGMTSNETQSLLGQHFRRVMDEPVSDSLPIFQGNERWQVWERL